MLKYFDTNFLKKTYSLNFQNKLWTSPNLLQKCEYLEIFPVSFEHSNVLKMKILFLGVGC